MPEISKIDVAIKLVSDIQKMETERDKIINDFWLSKNKGYKTVGKSNVVFYLETLKELLQEIKETE